MAVPKTTTRPMADATSSSASTAPSTAATAAAPQIEKPQAMSSRCIGGTTRALPMKSVPPMPNPTMSRTTMIIPGPSARMSPSASCRPSTTIPSRRSRLAAPAPGQTHYSATRPTHREGSGRCCAPEGSGP